VICVAFLWKLEEPGKLNTICVALIVYFLSFLFIHKAKEAGVIKSEAQWMAVFLIKIILTVVITKYFWVQTLGDWLREEFFFDPTAYDLYGTLIAQGGFGSSMELSRVGGFNTYGIIWYIGLIYKLFGVSTVYVALFNTLFSLIAFLSVTGILVLFTGCQLPWQVMRFGLFFPEIAYYDSIPAKEPLTVGLFALSLYFFCRCTFKPHSFRLILYTSISFAGLVLIRPPVVLLWLIVAIVIFLKGKPLTWKKAMLGNWPIVYKTPLKRLGIVAIICIMGVLVLKVMAPDMGELLKEEISLESKAQLAEDVREQLPSDNPAKQEIHERFVPHNFKELLLYAPIKIGMFLLGPFPQVIPDTAAVGNVQWGDGRFEVWLHEFNRFSMWLIVLFLPAVFSGVFYRTSTPRTLYKSIVLTFVGGIVLIPHNFLLIHLRYRTLVDPFLLATALIGYRYGKPRRFVLPALAILLGGIVSYELLAR
jgi:hypothetical protein